MVTLDWGVVFEGKISTVVGSFVEFSGFKVIQVLFSDLLASCGSRNCFGTEVLPKTVFKPKMK